MSCNIKFFTTWNILSQWYSDPFHSSQPIPFSLQEDISELSLSFSPSLPLKTSTNTPERKYHLLHVILLVYRSSWAHKKGKEAEEEEERKCHPNSIFILFLTYRDKRVVMRIKFIRKDKERPFSSVEDGCWHEIVCPLHHNMTHLPTRCDSKQEEEEEEEEEGLEVKVSTTRW